ncbi:DJ-1/PfpI family protein [Actinomadura craniellae]|uniref:DJ-1/PfpI family protein n=1 Tax=Actinomadura craniellae TaxID=2231787 RepID=A0A365H016_9ACTN|nr:DJ-1/PfpI family protein [Actinomadura craniellae]RAY12429.1 DJ-1/PfpI family protein [Actinomadura craniellae]
MTETQSRTVAFVLYPGLTPLDLVGPLQVFSVLEQTGLGFRPVVVGAHTRPVGTDTPLLLAASHTFAEVPDPYAVIVPGGDVPTLRALADEELLDYLRRVAEPAEIVGSVCTGSLLLAGAGLLDGRRAATHWAYRDVLARLGAVPVAERWVEDGRFVTAAGVSAGIDMALHLVRRLAGDEMTRLVQLGIEYDPEPPLGPIDWSGPEAAVLDGWSDRSVEAAVRDRPELAARLLA